MTLTTLAGGRPRRTRSSTSATAARPASRVEVVRPPHRRPAGHPDGVGDRGDLAEQLDGGGAAADDQHPAAAEVLGARVVDGVQLLAAEGLDARVVRHERAGPGAGRVDQGRGSCQLRSPARTTSRSPSSVTRSTRTGRDDGQVVLALVRRRTSRARRRWHARHARGPASRAGRRCRARRAIVSESQRCCQAPPGASLASSTRWSIPSRVRWYDEARPAWPAPMTIDSWTRTSAQHPDDPDYARGPRHGGTGVICGA